MIVRLILFGLFFYLIYFLLKYMFFKPFKEGYGQAGRNGTKSWHSTFSRRREGEVTISYDPRKNSKSENKVGDYVDYEEVKE